MQTSPEIFLDTFPALESLGFLRHAFTGRAGEIDVVAEREEVLARLEKTHAAVRATMSGPEQNPFIFGAQIHGKEVACVDAKTCSPVPGVDGILTATPGVTLGVYVADCCAIYLVDPERRAIGLLHSGRKGSELGIASVAIEKMRTQYGCEPRRMIAQLSPCIRPPHFEIDFAALIVAQCRAAGIEQVFDCGTCTASRRERYYSYRMELGKTGRMLALLSMEA